jgi:hypothetical protein
MISNSDYLIVSFEIETDGEPKRLTIKNLPILPAVGDEVQCDYVHGEKSGSRFKG